VIAGAGRATVRTAAFYRPGARVRVTKRSGATVSSREMTVGASGRVRVPVVLSSDATPGTTRVAIRQVGAPSAPGRARRLGDGRARAPRDRHSRAGVAGGRVP